MVGSLFDELMMGLNVSLSPSSGMWRRQIKTLLLVFLAELQVGSKTVSVTK